MIKPVESLVYLYYKCSECGEVGDEMRLAEVSVPNPVHVCPFCNHADQIKPIKDIQILYNQETTTTSKEDFSAKNHAVVDSACSLLTPLGYKSRVVRPILERLVSQGVVDVKDLFRRTVLELEDDEPFATNEVE